jgi:hypothetical protein
MKRKVLREYVPECPKCGHQKLEPYEPECDCDGCECPRVIEFNPDHIEATEELDNFDVIRMTSGRIFHLEKREGDC